ncbi:uncharacterized protein EURHEDRAFT_415339 [Aspergillus ruber CBS 135680]|uniref:Uncharacterized protein n=1 Tax=Aspergillus ruber (strain CBS 135680) TaxID=1388766 RepID=A0A017S6M1_ASPRC|nr:uncharacterized protein EURHEDRAFT_415339 [Aspergillus ruber CBS 135680]EYE92572.1 hypothetical protein EURHEDRAFT_415339 [Aspergillus ruber CBS 135680]
MSPKVCKAFPWPSFLLSSFSGLLSDSITFSPILYYALSALLIGRLTSDSGLTRVIRNSMNAVSRDISERLRTT